MGLAIWIPAAMHAAVVLTVLAGCRKQFVWARQSAREERSCEEDDELMPLSSPSPPAGLPVLTCCGHAARVAACGLCFPDRAYETQRSCSSRAASRDATRDVCWCCWLPIDLLACARGQERQVAAAALAVGSLLRIFWVLLRQGVLVDDAMAFLVVDVMLLRVPQCLWAWAFMLMAVVWKDIAAAASGVAVSLRFRCGMNAMGALLLVAEVALTAVASPLLSTDDTEGLILYHIGDGLLALMIVGLALAGFRAVWGMLALLRTYRAGAGTGRCGRCCADGCCRWLQPCGLATDLLCTPIARRERRDWAGPSSALAGGPAELEADTFDVVYEALRQTTLGMLGGACMSAVLITGVVAETALDLGTSTTPNGYLVFLSVFLMCEAVGGLLLASMSWPRSA